MLQYFATLNRLEKLTPLRFCRLLQYFDNDAKRIWQAKKVEWVQAGVEQKAVVEIWREKEKLDPDTEFAKLAKIGVQVLPITSNAYPKLLKEIYDPPPVLLVRGKFPEANDNYAVAVVGSRITSTYGRQVTAELTRGLVQAGAVIVSGLALGIDAVAHQTTIDVGARTIVVLGNGIDTIYPPRNRKLAEDILAKGGAIISEYPIGAEPTVYSFPQRNRIIAGLSRGVLVTEAREKSGALITAKLALESNREVFAVPGSIFAETSAGPNKLIQEGARPVLQAKDVLEVLNFEDLNEKIKVRQIIADSPAEEVILKILSKTPIHADKITRESGLTVSEASAVLSLLEMKGLAVNLGGACWVRV